MRIGREFGVAIFLILLILIVPSFWRAVQTSYQPATIVTSSIPTVPSGGSELKYDDWLEALSWMRENTPQGSVIFAWWDYGYWITALGDRRSLADNGTQNATQIGMIAQAFLSNQTFAMPTLRRYNVSYVAIFITPSGGSSTTAPTYQGFGEDGKWYWMARIGNNSMWNNYKIVFQEKQNPQAQSSTYYRVIYNGTQVLGNESITDNNQLNDKTMLGYMMQRATVQSPTSQNIPYFTQVFSSSNRYVYLFQVNYVTETQIKMSPIRSPIDYGQNVTIMGNLTDTNGRPLDTTVGVELQYSATGQTWNKVDEFPASPTNGAFNYTWTPNGGKVQVRVFFAGIEGSYVQSTSDTQDLEVRRLNVTMTLRASTTTSTLGQSITFSWSMQPFVNDANATLYYTLDNRTFQKIKSFIMTSPSMDYTWRVDVTGTFRVLVVFSGNQNYSESISAPVIIKVG
jgi:asparagine N-glycosylation enzyme membrane subunit Stt3